MKRALSVVLIALLYSRHVGHSRHIMGESDSGVAGRRTAKEGSPPSSVLFLSVRRSKIDPVREEKFEALLLVMLGRCDCVRSGDGKRRRHTKDPVG